MRHKPACLPSERLDEEIRTLDQVQAAHEQHQLARAEAKPCTEVSRVPLLEIRRLNAVRHDVDPRGIDPIRPEVDRFFRRNRDPRGSPRDERSAHKRVVGALEPFRAAKDGKRSCRTHYVGFPRANSRPLNQRVEHRPVIAQMHYIGLGHHPVEHAARDARHDEPPVGARKQLEPRAAHIGRTARCR